MEALFTLGIVICFFAAIVGGVTAVIVRFARSSPNIRSAPGGQPPKPDSLPYSKKQYFFSAAERSFYEVLKRLVSAEHTVFAKVRLVDLVGVRPGAGNRQSHLNRINRKHVDFVLCNRDLAPVVAIELDDSSHEKEDRKDRDEFVDQVLASVAFPIVHIRAKRSYAPDEIRAALHPYLPAKSAAEVPHPDERYMPPAGWRPAV